MKTFLKYSLLAAGLAVASVPLFADAPATTPAPAAGQAVAKHPRLARMMQRRAMVRRQVAKRLDLSADQIATLKANRAQTRTALQGLRNDTSLTQDQKRAKAREIIQSARGAGRATLTPEQQKRAHHMRKRFQAFRKHRMNRRNQG